MIIYKITFPGRVTENIFPFYYIGSKSNCEFIDGKIISKGKEYTGSSCWDGWSDIIQNEEYYVEVLESGFSDYHSLIEREREYHEKLDVVASVEYFNLSIATVNNFSDPACATYKHTITGKTVRLPRDHHMVISGEYVGVTKGRSVVNDLGHSNRGKSGNENGFYGKSHSEETKRIISEKAKGRKASDETRRKMSEKRKGVPKSAEHKSKIGRSGLIVLKNIHTNECVRIPKSDTADYDPTVWMNPSAIATIKSQPVTCPHCGKSGKGSIMKRWHFDNCKQKT